MTNGANIINEGVYIMFSNRIGKAIFTSVALMTVSLCSISSMASDAIAPGDSDSKWVVGGQIGTISNPYAGEDTVGFILPNVEYRGENFFVKDGHIAYKLFGTSGFSGGITLTGRGSFLYDDDEYEDNRALAGLKEKDGTLDAGFYLLHKSSLGRLKVTVLDEITGEHNGQSADINYIFDFKIYKWYVNPVIGLAWSSSNSVDHFYGVSEDEETATRAAYEGDDTIDLYTGIRGRYEFTQHWDINLAAVYVNLGSGITDSSIVDEDELFISSVGASYNF